MFLYSFSALMVLFLTRQSRAQCEHDAVGIGDGRVPDAQLTASSETSTAKNGRLGNHSSWCAAGNDLTPYLQIDLGENYVICAAATQGNASSSGDGWVETYQLQSSMDGAVWRNYTVNGLGQVINGNSDPRSTAKRILLEGIIGRYIRFIPREYHGNRCLRVELYGKPVVDLSQAVGVANSSIVPANRFSASSEYDTRRYKASNARLNGTWGWGPTNSDMDTAHLQIDLGTVYTIYAIATQGNGGTDRKGGEGDDEWVKMYKLKILSVNGVWSFYKEVSTVQNFIGNVDKPSVVTNILPRKVTAVAVQIVPVAYHVHPTLRVELYHIPFPAVDPSKALGVANTVAFPDSRFSSPSEYNRYYRALYGRLNGVRGWAPVTTDIGTAKAYLQIDLGTVNTIYAIATQGNGGDSGNGDGPENEWVETYKLETSLDKTTWSLYKEGSTDKIFQGNTDQPTIVTNVLRVETAAVAIRVIPVDYHRHPTLRVELYGPPPRRPEACATIPVGLTNRTVIPDHRFSAPSSMIGKSPYMARLHGSKGWIPEVSHKDSDYLEIDLGAAYMLCAIATQGSDSFWVTQYRLTLSMDGVTCVFNKTFTANYDDSSVVKNFIDSPTQAKFIHIKPTAYHNQPALRVEVYGSVRGVMAPFGLENNVIPDVQIRASSNRDSSHTAKEGRLYNTKSWCAGGNGTDEYLQVDLGKTVTITGLATQADPRGTGWVKSYSIGYSNDGKEWRKIQTDLVINKYKGNQDGSAVLASWFSGSLVARFVKILPQTHEKAICVRIEVYGNAFVEPSILRPMLQNQTLKKQPNSSVTMACNIYSAGIVRVVWLLNRTNISNSSSITILTLEPKSTFYGPTVSTLTVMYGNASLAKSTFKCRKVSDMERVLDCLSLAVECRAEDANGATVSSASFISLFNSLVLPAKTQAPTLSFIGENFINISWPRTDPGDSKVTSYSIFYRDKKSGKNNTKVVASGTGSTNISTQLNGLQPFTPYMVQVRAVSVIGSGDLSDKTTFVTHLAASISVSPPAQTLRFGADQLFLPLKCSGQGFPLPKITWKRNGSPLQNTSHLTLYMKQLSEINATSAVDLKPGGIDIKEAGNYTCEVYNGVDGQGVLSATVQVFFQPRVFVLEPVKRVFRRGTKDTIVPCSGHGYPTPKVYWKKDNKTITSAARDQLVNLTNSVVQVQTVASSPLTNSSSVLYLRTSGLTYNEAGVYKCVVSNGPGVNHSASISMEVLFFPEFTLSPSSQVVLEGENVTFNCSASGVPPPSVTWSFSGGNMSSFTINQESLRLYGVQNTGNFEGNYTCAAESRAGTNKAIARLTVDVVPKISNHLKNQTIVLGSLFTTFCDVRGDPWPNITWSVHNKTAIQHSNVSSDGRNITVLAVALSQIGIYRCLAENRVGFASSSAWINIIAVPKVYISSQQKLKLFIGAKEKSVICNGNGFPDPTIIWKRNGEVIPIVTSLTSNDSDHVVQVLSNKHTVPLANISSTLYLRVGGVTYKEAGNYTCVVKILGGLSNAAIQSVEVIFVPEFSTQPSNRTVLSGRNATFYCAASGKPDPRITWKFSGGALPPHQVHNGNLTVLFIKNSVKYEGAYTCVVSNKAAEISATAWLTVDVAPKITSIFSNQSMLMNEKLNLTCEATGDPEPSIRWVKDGHVKSFNRVLSIAKVGLGDIGLYKCIAHSRAGNHTASVWVNVQAHPILHISPPLTRKLLKQQPNVSIDCYGSGHPAPSVMWIRNRSAITTVKQYNEDYSTSVVQVITGISSPLQNVTARLYLRNAGVTYKEAGNYTCVVNNTVKGKRSVVEQNLEILFAPDFLTQPSNRTDLSGRNVTFYCAASGKPDPRITWKFSGGALPPHQFHNGNLTVLFTKNSVEYEGTYTCVVSNKAGEISATAWLTVDYAPKITSTFSNQSMLLNEKLNLTCEATGDPEPTINWVKDGVVKSLNGTLTIAKIGLGDIGLYRCIARSRAGNYTTSVWVDVEAHPILHVSPPLIRKLQKQQPSVSIDCYGNGHPAPSVMWIRNRSVVPIKEIFSEEYKDSVVQVITGISSPLQNITARLYLRTAGVTYKEAGNYTCVANNTVRGQVSVTEQVLQILFVPEFVEKPSNVTALTGSNATFLCVVTGIPKPAITWNFSGGVLAEHVLNDEGSLSVLFINNSATYEGAYTCKASSIAGERSATAWLSVDVSPKVLSTFTNQSLLQTETLNLTCDATGEPYPAVTWVKDGVRKSSSSKLIIRNLDLDDIGRYQCIARNRAGSDTTDVWIDIQARPSVYVTPPATRRLTTHRNNITIDCYGNGYPEPSVVWRRNNTVIPVVQQHNENYSTNVVQVITGVRAPLQNVSARLYLRTAGVTYKEAGNYTCVANNTVQGKESIVKQNLEILFKPEFFIVPQTSIAQVGQEVRFNCSATGIPTPHLTWTFSNGALPEGHTLVGSDLVIGSVQNNRVYEGTFTCTASSRAGVASASAELIVYVPPTIKSHPKSLVAERWSTVNFTCLASGDPPPTYEWSWNGPAGKELRAEFQDQNRSFVIRNVTERDNGTYTCLATNAAGKVISSANLTVHARPRIVKKLEQKATVIAGGTMNFTCFGEGIPAPVVTWSWNNKTIAEEERYDIVTAGNTEKHSMLTVREVKYGDRGVYTCLFTNYRGTARSAARLTVYVTTTITAAPESLRQRVQLPVTLNCSARGFPLPSIRWKKAGTEIRSDNHVVILTTFNAGSLLVHSGLYIANVNRSDTENYTCVASNLVNKEKSNAKITVLEKPDKLDVKLVAKSAWSVTLTWTPNFIGNSPVTWFTVSYNVSQSRPAHNISSDKLRSTVQHLNPATVYSFHVTATNDIGQSEPAVFVVVTDEWRPEHPRNVTATFINSTSFQVSWTKPEVTNGVLKLYVMYYWPTQGNVTSANNVTAVPSRTSAIATNLRPYTNYSSRVQAFTAIGGGNLSEPIISIQTHEDAPSAPRDLEIMDTRPFSIIIQWRKPLVLNGVLRGYTVTLVSKNDPLPNRNVTQNYLTDTVTFTLSSLEAFTRYSIQVRAFTIKYGEYSNKMDITTLESTPGEPRNVTLIKSEDLEQVTVKWKTPKKPNGIILRYTVHFAIVKHSGNDKPNSKNFKSERNGTQISVALDMLNGATTYEVTVQGETEAGKGNMSTNKAILETNARPPPPPPPPSPPADTTETTAVIVIPKFSDINGKIRDYKIYVVVLPSNTEGSSRQVKSVDDIDIFDWSTVYEKVDQTSKPAAYIAFVFLSEEYNNYRTFTLGDEEKYPAKRIRRAKEEFRNGKLRSNREYVIFVRAYVSDEIYAETAAISLQTKPTPKPTTDETGSSVAIIVIVVIVVAILVAIIGVGLYVRRRSRSSGSSTREESIRLRSMPTNETKAMYDQPVIAEQKLPIPVENLKQHYLRMHADKDILFKEEYKSIQTPGNPTTVCCDAPVNKTKNRYANIKAYDHSRVALAKKPGVEDSDYINANYIDGYKCKKRYIATIGPKPETEDAFWQMVWEQHSSVIVMLTRTVENGKLKCHQYWPEDETKDYDGITVKLMETEELADYEIRTFKLHTPSKPGSQPRTVTHFFFTAWPDHDVPNHATSLLEFWRRVKHAVPDRTGPIVVHCSAGVGRTGTFIVIDAMMAQIEAKGEVDVYGFVTHIRGQRMFMVQRESQYAFIHYAILEAVTFGNTEIAVQDLRVKLRELNKKDRSTGESEMQRQFQLLNGAVPDENNDFSTALMAENYSKNRQANILPFERTRVQLEQEENIEGKDTTFINANFIGGYQLKTAFIATQAPLKSTVADFWRMVWEQDVCSIVMLARDDEQLKVPLVRYWPLKGSILSGNINVELGEQIPHKGFTERCISITNTKVGEVRRVRQYQYTEWPSAGRPASASSVIDMIGCVQKLQMQTGNKPIVVHCSDGVGRTGAFCCISSSVERIKTEGIIDVFSAARMLRTQRPGMINRLEQYRFCYDAIVAYLDSFEEYQYQNFQ